VVLLWNLFTGSFSPFFNVFFSHRYQRSFSEIGLIFSASQLFQMAAVFCMPYLVSQMGSVRALSSMQLAAALTLPLLAFANHAQTAAALYLLYISLQVMGEPALESFIMNSVSESERSLTSAIRYTVHFLVQALAAGITGHFLEKLGYSIPFFVVGATGVLAACTFYLCFRNSSANGSNTVVQYGS